ncbi:MAG: hypothetical protein AAGA93_25890 [Actinomycetota bacterium]
MHRTGCTCRRPYLGRALVTSVIIECLLAIVTVAAGAPLVGLVACAAMAGCMAVAVVAEIVAFYRIGLGQADDPGIGRNRGTTARPGQMSW